MCKSIATGSLSNIDMPERGYQLQERLEALVRFSAPGEFENPYEPAKALEATRVGGPRRKNPRSGGILVPRDSKASWAVNIRPKNWGNKDKIWMGKIKSLEDAQRIADIIFHYLGCGPVHFLFPGRERPPPFLNDKLQTLDSVEKRLKYVKYIAKGDEFLTHRRELMESVKEMVKHLTIRQDEFLIEPPLIASCNIVDPSTETCNVVNPFTGTWNARSPPELGAETFDQAYGRRLSYDIPVLPQANFHFDLTRMITNCGLISVADEIESMMNILLPDDVLLLDDALLLDDVLLPEDMFRVQMHQSGVQDAMRVMDIL